MVEITFKDVGQGDSILIEWDVNGKRKIGIIDCNIHRSSNPVLNHIINNKFSEIEFLILSHPHLDHFSGFVEVLHYCKQNKIQIKKFLHTAQTTPDYLKAATRSIAESTKLFQLFQLLNSLVEDGNISVHSIDDHPDLIIPLGDEFKMEVLAPSSREINKYIDGEKYPFDEETTGHPNANWLSTLFKIYNSEINILLTSDIEAGVLTRIGNSKTGRLGKGKIILAQTPHHGSKSNLNKIFWNLRRRCKTTPIAISVGKNNYKHPSEEVIDFFNKLPNYEIHRTDYNPIKSSTEKSIELTGLLNVFSSEFTIDKNDTSGDKKFTITNSEISFN